MPIAAAVLHQSDYWAVVLLGTAVFPASSARCLHHNWVAVQSRVSGYQTILLQFAKQENEQISKTMQSMT